MNRQVGSVSWSAPSEGATRSEEGKKLPFLDMKDFNKSYKMRVVSDNPMMYHCHWVTSHEGRNVKVNCTLTKDCPVVDQNTKTRCGGTSSQARYYIKVLDRSDGQIKVLDIGTQIFKQIVDLHLDDEWGHSKHYDITIKKGAKGDNPLYSVIPGVKKPLSEDEAELVRASSDPTDESFIDLESRCKPLSADVINKILTGQDLEPKARAGRTAPQSQPQPQPARTTKPTPTPTPTTSSKSDEDEDMIDWGDDT